MDWEFHLEDLRRCFGWGLCLFSGADLRRYWGWGVGGREYISSVVQTLEGILGGEYISSVVQTSGGIWGREYISFSGADLRR